MKRLKIKFQYINHKLLIIFIFFLSITLVFRFLFFYQNKPEYKDGQTLSFETDLLSQPQIFAKSQRFTAFLEGGQRVFVYAPRFPQLNYGDRVRIIGKLNVKLLKDGDSIFIMSYPKIEAKNDSQSKILAIGSFVRQKIISTFEKILPRNSSGLLLGIVFGIKEEIPRDFYEILRNSGTLHVTAASGMNVTMAGGFLAALFSFVLRRQIAVAASIVGILFYAVFAGLEPSIVRASIMGILVFSSQILGRQSWAAFALLLTAYFMLLFNPALLQDVGFQLSFLATAGLIFILPLFAFRDKVWGSDLATTISAQLAVLPILFSNFGTYSLWSIAANTAVLWTIPILMILGGLAALVGLVFESLASIFLYSSLPLLLYFEKAVSIFASFPQMNINISSWSFTLGYYCILIALIILGKTRKTQSES